MKTSRRKLRKSEWVIILAPLIAFAAVGGGPLWQRVWHRYFPVQLKGQAGRIGTMVFSPDSRYLAITSVGGGAALGFRKARDALGDESTRLE